MTAAATSPSPFDLLLNPEAVLAAIHGSERLNRLNSRICRPLDKPLPNTGEKPPVGDLQSIAENGLEGLHSH